MRISDWSSDVCSSDLSAAAGGGWMARAALARLRRPDNAGGIWQPAGPGTANDDALHRIAELEHRVAQLEVALAAAVGLPRPSAEPRIARLAAFPAANELRTGERWTHDRRARPGAGTPAPPARGPGCGVGRIHRARVE